MVVKEIKNPGMQEKGTQFDHEFLQTYFGGKRMIHK